MFSPLGLYTGIDEVLSRIRASRECACIVLMQNIKNWLICLAHFQLKSLALTCCLEHDGTKEHGLSIKQGSVIRIFTAREFA